MFIQYYSKLIELLQDHAYQLYECICQRWCTSHSWIVTYFKSFSFSTSMAELALAIQAMKLHSRSTYSFYKMLKFMESSEQIVQQLAAEMKLKVETLDPNKSSGT